MDMERRGWHTQATEIIQLLNKEEDMMKEAYAQSIECEEPCEGGLSRTVLWEGEGETPSLYSTLSRLRDAVNEYLEASGANRPSIGGEETILAHRKIAANRLAIDCIYALSKEELSKVDRELEGIVSNLPRQGCGMRM